MLHCIVLQYLDTTEVSIQIFDLRFISLLESRSCPANALGSHFDCNVEVLGVLGGYVCPNTR